MSVKYGPIICDPTSEEAKALIGKKIVGSDFYLPLTEIDESLTKQGVLINITEVECCPFELDENGCCAYTFIREVIEEAPQYRPYKDTEEMVDDFCERFGRLKLATTMPFIWVKGKETKNTFLVEAFITRAVKLGGNTFPFESLFNKFTYLDGSPVGKEEQDG